MSERILVTGAAGFIGHKLNSFLKGKYEVLGLDFNIINSRENIYFNKLINLEGETQ